jgi:hypothetical protein
MPTTKKQSSLTKSNEKMDKWFEGMINSITVDQLQLQTETANEEKVQMYMNMIEGKHYATFSKTRNISSQFFIEELVKEYLSEINSRKVNTKNLAFELSDAKILVWAEITESDDQSENGLILSEAKTNAKFSKYGFHISSTIVDDCDNVKIPPHYALIK